ncbi:hypothetical protein [Streptomyces californicus]|uniref:hypothetical protein n=1 Tax=Streptomyces californicus TaxID=67351 RepID=UPI0036F519D6
MGSGGDGAHQDYSSSGSGSGGGSSSSGDGNLLKMAFTVVVGAVVGAVLAHVLLSDGEATFYAALAGGFIGAVYRTFEKKRK